MRRRPFTKLRGQLDDALGAHGLMTRGALRDGERTIVLVGHAGSTIWPHFSRWWTAADNCVGADPLDRWSRAVLQPIAEFCGAAPVFPFEKPYRPFQRWALEAEGLLASPLGILIHPEYGLWHAYRGALIFHGPLDVPLPPAATHPCDRCTDKPCLTSCPAGAFSNESKDVRACAAFLRLPDGASCLDKGCRARLACPVGRDYAYTTGQQRFHMAAFKRSRTQEQS